MPPSYPAPRSAPRDKGPGTPGRAGPATVAVVGIQPNSLSEMESGDWERILQLASAAKVGELFQYTVGTVSLPRLTRTSVVISEIAARSAIS